MLLGLQSLAALLLPSQLASVWARLVQVNELKNDLVSRIEPLIAGDAERKRLKNVLVARVGPLLGAVVLAGLVCGEVSLALLCWVIGFGSSLLEARPPEQQPRAKQQSPDAEELPASDASKAAAELSPTPDVLTPSSASPAESRPPSPVPSSSSPLVSELRERVAPTKVDDDTASRFLAARKNDVAKAAKQFEAYAAWRKAECIDEILEEKASPNEELEADARMFKPVVLDGLDYHGRPVLFISVGRTDCGWLGRRGFSIKACLRRYVGALERLSGLLERTRAAERAAAAEAEGEGEDERQTEEEDGEREAGETTTGDTAGDAAGGASSARARGFLMILDVHEGNPPRFFSGWKLWAGVADVDNKYYPGLMDAVCVVRAPPVAQWALGVCKKSFLDDVTADKISLDCQLDPTSCLAEILPPEVLCQLPSELLQKPAGRC